MKQFVKIDPDVWVDMDAVRCIEESLREDEWQTKIVIAVGSQPYEMLSRWSVVKVANEMAEAQGKPVE